MFCQDPIYYSISASTLNKLKINGNIIYGNNKNKDYQKEEALKPKISIEYLISIFYLGKNKFDLLMVMWNAHDLKS